MDMNEEEVLSVLDSGMIEQTTFGQWLCLIGASADIRSLSKDLPPLGLESINWVNDDYRIQSQIQRAQVVVKLTPHHPMPLSDRIIRIVLLFRNPYFYSVSSDGLAIRIEFHVPPSSIPIPSRPLEPAEAGLVEKSDK